MRHRFYQCTPLPVTHPQGVLALVTRYFRHRAVTR